MKRQRENLRYIQKTLMSRKGKQFYTKHICKNNKTVLMELKEDKKKYSVLKQQLKDNRNQINQHNTNIRLIDQQVEQLIKDQNNMEMELETKYFQDLITQEVRNYTHLISSNLDDLKKMLFREDFELKGINNQFPENKFYSRVTDRVKEFKFNRKKIFYCLIITHLFIKLKNIKVKKYLQNKDKFNQEVRENQSFYHTLVFEGEQFNHYLKRLENNNSVQCQNKQKLEQNWQNLQSYLTLKQQSSQIKKANPQYALYEAHHQQIQQMKLGILNELKQNIEKTEQIINLGRDDLNSGEFQVNILQEYKQVCIERNNMKEQNKDVISLKQELDQYENKIKKIRLELVKQTPQIDNLSEEQIQKEIDNLKQELQKLEEQISQDKAEYQNFNERRSKSLIKKEELKNKLIHLEKKIESKERSINTQSNQAKQIHLKFNQLKLKQIQSQEQLLSDFIQIKLEIDRYNRNNDANKIQKEFEEFISQLGQGGSNHINVSFEQYFSNYGQQVKKFDEEKKILLDKKTLILEDLAKYKQLRQEKKIGRQTIKKAIQKYKQQNERIKRRSQLFDLVVRK